MVNLKDAQEKIENVFQRDSKEIYNIPLYQRPYSWGEEEINQFCEDIFDLNENSEYLLGSIILVKDKNNPNKYDVIDGQQRLTTISIFLAMFKFFVDEQYKSEIEGRLNSRNSNDKKIQRLKTHSELDLDFRNLLSINKEKFLKELSENKKFKKNRYYQNAKLILDQLEVKKKEKFNFNDFFVNIFLEIYLIRVICEDMGFAMKTFEVLNNRGLPLKNSDLIKNELFSELNDYNEEGDSLNAKWNELVSLIEADEDKKEEEIDDLFTIYIYSKLGRNPEKSNFDEFKDLFKQNYKSKNLSSIEFIMNFSTFVDNYINLYKHPNIDIRRKIYAMSYLKDSRFWKAIILSAFEMKFETKTIDKLINELFKFYYLNLIGGISVNRHKNLSFSIIKEINENAESFSIENLKSYLEKFQKDESVLRNVNDKLNGEIYKKGWEKNLLLLIENYYLSDEKDEEKIFKFNDVKIQIEHIFPQNPEIKWDSIIEKDKNLINYKNKLGNLTLLYGSKNRVCSNKIFSEKIKLYKGLKSNQNFFMITNSILNENLNTWDSTLILARMEKLFRIIESIFDLENNTLNLIEMKNDN